MRPNRGMGNECIKERLPTDLGMVESFAGEVTFEQGSEVCVRVYLFLQKLRVPFKKWCLPRDLRNC